MLTVRRVVLIVEDGLLKRKEDQVHSSTAISLDLNAHHSTPSHPDSTPTMLY
jgi:hypothetical protein